MAIKKIVKVWDNSELISDNISFLGMKTKNVFFPLTESSNKIIGDLIDTYQKIPCAGVAANQIGYDKSIFIGLAKLEKIQMGEKEKKPPKSATAVIKGLELFVPLAGLIDINKEIERLNKQITDMNGRLTAVNRKLENKNFVNNAPENIINHERKKQQNYKADLSKLQQNLESLEI